MKIKQPAYFDKFKCVGGTCEDNCCIGWDVEIDRNTYRSYKRLKDKELSTLFRKKVFENENPHNFEIDYAMVELGAGNRCPFLNEDNLCKIQKKMGDSFLSNVCATYPRMANEVDRIVEYSATVSCPEAARLILGNQEKITWITQEVQQLGRTIINYHVDTNGAKNNPLFGKFLELRDLAIKTIQNRDETLGSRLQNLGRHYREIEKDMGLSPREGKATQRSQVTMDFPLKYIHNIVKSVNRQVVIDSQVYKKLGIEAEKGIGLLSGNSMPNKMEINEAILENYLVNYMFQELFPIGEGGTLTEAHEALAVRYVLIKYHLLGIGSYRGQLSDGTTIEFLQAFSKAIEHHNLYLGQIKKVFMKENVISQIVLGI